MNIDQAWNTLLTAVQKEKISLFFALKSGQVLHMTETSLHIGVEKEPYFKELTRKENLVFLEDVAKRAFGRPLAVEISKERKVAILQTGTPVIVTYVDRPEARLVAIVEEGDVRDCIYARYLCADLQSASCYAHYEEVTPISDFGMRLIVAGSQYKVTRYTGESKAKYRDGSVRYWQETNLGQWIPMDPKTAQLLKYKKEGI